MWADGGFVKLLGLGKSLGAALEFRSFGVRVQGLGL